MMFISEKKIADSKVQSFDLQQFGKNRAVTSKRLLTSANEVIIGENPRIHSAMNHYADRTDLLSSFNTLARGYGLHSQYNT